MPEVILTIDIGSSSIKCVAYELVSHHNDSNDFKQPHDDHATFTVRAIPNASCTLERCTVSSETGRLVDVPQLLKAVDDCVDQVVRGQHVGDRHVIKSIGFSSLAMNLVGLDSEGHPVGDEATLTYACHSSDVAHQVQQLQCELGETQCQSLYQKTGTPIHSAYALPQLRALYQKSPALVEKIHCWQTLSNLVIARWTGQTPQSLPISYSEASWTGLLNVHSGQYEPEVMDLLPALPSEWPPVADWDICDLKLTGAYAEKWPSLSQARLFGGVGDGACANVGSKCTTASRIACTIGTSAAARLILYMPICSSNAKNDFTIPKGLFCYRIDRQFVLVGGALTDGGSVVEWIRGLLNLTDPGALEACLNTIRDNLEQAQSLVANNAQSLTTVPSRPRLSTVPFLSGERSTGFRVGATGVMYGLIRETTAADLVQSCLEGVTLRLGAIVERLLPLTDQTEGPPQILVSGKALEVNQVWRQMISNCTGLDVILDRGTMGGTSKGVALLMLSRLTKQTKEDLHGLPVEPLETEQEFCHSPQMHSETYWNVLKQDQENLLAAVEPLFSNHS